MLSSEMILRAWTDQQYRASLVEQGYEVPEAPADPESIDLGLEAPSAPSVSSASSSSSASSASSAVPRGARRVLTPRGTC